jgi:hypothetical protein
MAKTEVLGEKPVTIDILFTTQPPGIGLGFNPVLNSDSTVTAWATAQPFNCCYEI